MPAAIDRDPLVSVIIPTYNRDWVLHEAIASVLEQDFKDFELIVIDDGSSDNTRTTLDRYKNDLIALCQPNKGVSAARNKGIQLARGRYIAFLDSDDTWLPQKLTMQVQFFESHPEALICQTEEIWIRKGVRVNPAKKHKKRSGMIFEPSLKLCLVSPSAVMIDKALFRSKGLFDESLPACEDYDLWLRISADHPIHLIDTPLIIKRGGHQDQLSSQHSLDKYRIQSLIKLIANQNLSIRQYEQAVKTLIAKCEIYSGGCIKRRRYREARTYQALIHKYNSLLS